MSETSTPPATSRFGKPRPKVPPFARYEGTSAFRIDRRRAREYARFKAAQRLSEAQAAPKA